MPVTIKRLSGEEVTINFTALALRKTEWAAMRDGFTTQVKPDAQSTAEPVPAFSFVDFVQTDILKSAGLVMQFAKGWDLEDEFSAESLADMEDRFGGSIGVTLQAYDAAIFHGRLGN